MWIPEEGCTIGLCDGLSIVRRESEKGPVALMTPWEAREIHKDGDLRNRQYPRFHFPLVTGQVVLHSGTLDLTVSIFEKLHNFDLVGDCCPKFDCGHYKCNVHARVIVLTFPKETSLADE
jgi:hypothetical protein